MKVRGKISRYLPRVFYVCPPFSLSYPELLFQSELIISRLCSLSVGGFSNTARMNKQILQKSTIYVHLNYTFI